MEIKGFTRIINELPFLTDNQIRLIRDRADSIIHKDSTTKLIDQCKSSDEVACPHCGSIKLNKWGMSAGLQRYRCKEPQCQKTFNALTKTPLARLRKRNLWSRYVECIAESKTIRQSARELGVAITTAFRWRHRFVSLPPQPSIKCLKSLGLSRQMKCSFLKVTKVNERSIIVSQESVEAWVINARKKTKLLYLSLKIAAVG